MGDQSHVARRNPGRRNAGQRGNADPRRWPGFSGLGIEQLGVGRLFRSSLGGHRASMPAARSEVNRKTSMAPNDRPIPGV
jgi:hypothetical protein